MENTEKKRAEIVAIGEVLIDFTSEKTDAAGYPTLKAHPGGAPANFLAAAQAAGRQTAFIGKVGDDAFGRLLLGTLREKNIDVSGVTVTEDAFTTLAFVTLDQHGDREFSFARKPGADSLLNTKEVPRELIKNADILHYGSLLMTTKTGAKSTFLARKVAAANGVIVSYDPNYRAPLWDSEAHAVEMMREGFEGVNLVKISTEEAELIFGVGGRAASKAIAELIPSVRLVAVTLGGDGAVLRSGENEVFIPAPKVNVLDTTGAGDICGGSIAAGLLGLNGFDRKAFVSGKKPLTAEELEKIGRYAVTAASLSTEKHGGIESVPSPEEVRSRL
ncbi:MAG: carbohydrate kinase [Clostridia bacterium]|nr:carbohydrate kinase [Clostridia bacterium]